MSLFVLDSDTLSLLQGGHSSVAARAAEHDTEPAAISVIAVDEQLRGWYSLVRRAKKPRDVAYDRLARSVAFLSRTPILSFTESAIARYEAFRKAKLRIGGNDLRIAAIALEHQATVVTRNLRDFKMIPGLIVEDWSN